MKNKYGFTLVEIVIVVVIIGVVASLAYSSYSIVVERMRAKEGDQMLYAAYAAQKRYMAETRYYASTISQLDVTFPPSAYFGAPVVNIDAFGQFSIAITRSGSYTLTIASNGNITCGGGPVGLCEKIGYGLTVPHPVLY